MHSILFRRVSKSYPIYRKPSHRLIELLSLGRVARREEHWALNDVSFEVGRGEVFCLLGENGSGKSTTLQLAAGIFPPTAGEIEVNGRVAALLELGAGFNPEFSGRDNIFLSGAVLGLSTREIRRRYPDIERFAEIGEFIDQPVKTYSSGMLVRLAFAAAIHVDPEVLLVDEALAVGDFYFRQRCLRKVHELRKRGVTILFVSHATADVKALGTRAMWLENGRVVEIGAPDAVVRNYLAMMSAKDAAFIAGRAEPVVDATAPPAEPPEIVEGLPNVDHRHGDGRAEIIGIAAFDEDGRRAQWIEPRRKLVLRVSARAKDRIDHPNVGFMMRNHLGMDFAGTNTDREGARLDPLRPGDVVTVDFRLDLPELYPGHFSFSPAVADGDHLSYRMCDWVENALALEMAHGGKQIYGYFHPPCEVRVNARLSEPLAADT